jgi:methylenetetrahydrofolate dehydrogenase (NADP+)/methenyltetrahydrofolate cyclohydrolase
MNIIEGNIIHGKRLADDLCRHLIEEVAEIKRRFAVTPRLEIVLVGNDPASEVYVGNKLKRAREIGMIAELLRFEATISQEELLGELARLNAEEEVHGIIVQLPVPPTLDKFAILAGVSPIKDIDGFNPINVGRLYSGVNCFVPATAQGVLMLIKEALGSNLSGKKAVVLGRSIIVGRPTAALLLRENCSVTILHSASNNIGAECATADILVCATGQKNMVPAEWVKEGACVIDVGIVTDEKKDIFGDVNFEKVQPKAGYITPVPGGVGPMTVACLMNNTVLAAKQQLGMVKYR